MYTNIEDGGCALRFELGGDHYTYSRGEKNLANVSADNCGCISAPEWQLIFRRREHAQYPASNERAEDESFSVAKQHFPAARSLGFCAPDFFTGALPHRAFCLRGEKKNARRSLWKREMQMRKCGARFVPEWYMEGIGPSELDECGRQGNIGAFVYPPAHLVRG